MRAGPLFYLEAAMPWSDLPDPKSPPMTKRQWMNAVLSRAAIVFVALLILGICGSSWFRVSAVAG